MRKRIWGGRCEEEDVRRKMWGEGCEKKDVRKRMLGFEEYSVRRMGGSGCEEELCYFARNNNL